MTETQTGPQVEVQKKSIPKIRSIVVDTVTSIQKYQVFETWGEGKKVNHDKWRDLGVDLVTFAKQLIDMGFTVVGIVGPPGTGKSYGMKFLKPGTNIWYNCDDKDSTYKGGKQEYGTRTSPTYLMKKPKEYQEIIDHISLVQSKGLLDANPIAFVIGHTEEYKSEDKTRVRLKTMGNIARANLEDMLTMCYYTEVINVGGKAEYKLRTQNSGLNSGRTLEGQHTGLLIDNNFQLIIDSYDNY